ncbi:hypothetical protein [Singulisphaera acidiphila]|uniref:Uncharacterized protein n=1 Tax=Singulisphaera acidiphila (strain ATCC BAA-1392 / DSM 18658 / VKM B-2454 / MOB10) TaxID=886293 RepID=L0DMX9_SINAD|nr:hypothetical protein [Singulisphaera acidiphila]AGA30198.1 hypothetical protein Sinac_6093 [Singulisphaera acidiphila DSM 18658]
MSFTHEKQVDDHWIDRLVDGELEETERCRLLALLEAEPGGWRRCALAFLEAQTWSRTLTLASASVTETLDSNSQGQVTNALIPFDRPVNPLRPLREPVSRRFPIRGILAAGILLAFACGWLAGGATQTFRPTAAPLPTGGATEVLTSLDEPNRDSDPGRESAEPPAPDQAEPPLRPQLEVPTSKAGAPLVLTDPVRRELERQGYHVRQRSGLVSMKLENGQSLAVPVDEVELRYVGNRIY